MVFEQHIILDVDNTLLYTSNILFKGLDKEKNHHFTIDMGSSPAYVYLRPHLKEFLIYLFNNYKSVSIWSLGNFEYISTILKELHKLLKIKLPFKFVFTLENSTEKHYPQDGYTMTIKDLNILWNNNKYKSIGMNKDNTLFVDDRADVLRETPKNHIIIKKYIAQKDDKELLKLLLYLPKIATKKNITRVKKDNWFSKDFINNKNISKIENILYNKTKIYINEQK